MDKFKGLALFIVLTSLITLMSPVNSMAELKIINILDVEALGGGSYIKVIPASSGVNLKIGWVPVFEFDENFSILPNYSASYRGIRILSELEDGLILYRQIQDHALSLKTTQQLDDGLKINVSASLLAELSHETADENWLGSLYNYNQGAFDLGIEKTFISGELPCNIKFEYNFSKTLFPNYLAPNGSDYEKELTGGTALTGERFFDHDTNKLSFYFDALTWSRVIFKCSYLFAYYNYPNQKIVDQTGGRHENENRYDVLHNINFSFDWLLLEFKGDNLNLDTLLGTFIEFKFLTSSQNYYDISAYDPFLPLFYSYSEQSINFPFKMQFTKPVKFNLSVLYKYTSKYYTNRTAQDLAGVYLNDNLKKNLHVWNFDLSYPIAANFSAIVNAGFVNADSNMQYEKIYWYNYSAFNFLAGIKYEY